MSIQYRLVEVGGERSLSVFAGGQLTVASESSHPLFQHIVDGLEAGTILEHDLVTMLGSVGHAIEQGAISVSDRISLSEDHRTLFFDGQKVDNTLSRHIVRLMREEGIGGIAPWVRFMEKLALNPSKLSRIHLYSWLEAVGDFTITPDGDILGYKSVRADRHSHAAGKEPVRVNDAIFQGRIPNPDGAVISMPRDLVDDDRNSACSVGLHIGSFEFANGFHQWGSTLLLVSVSPEDVVSVPSDAGSQKMRACRYRVIGEGYVRSQMALSSWDHDELGVW